MVRFKTYWKSVCWHHWILFSSDQCQNFCNVPTALPLLLKVCLFFLLIGHVEILVLVIYWICGPLQLRTVLFSFQCSANIVLGIAQK